ncbi:MAG: hypothetical protein HYX91_01775 [Chloroflexi bacterium]|nr:hypothetical protein [Chloroflexota bacterium]
MGEFLQSYGIWIFVGLLLFMMLRGHRHSGCNMGQQQPQEQEIEDKDDAARKGKSGSCH